MRRAVDSSPRRSRRRKRRRRRRRRRRRHGPILKRLGTDNIYNEAELGSGPGKVAAPKAKRKGSGREQRVKSE